MGFKDRLRRLEEVHPPEECPECRGFIILEEHHEDGSVTFPHGEPCQACGSEGYPGGPVARIVVERTEKRMRT